MKTNRLLIVLMATITVLAGCQKIDINLDSNQANRTPVIQYYEHSAMNVSTFIADTFITSGSGAAYVGYYRDEVLGSMSASSYLSVNLPANNALLNTQTIYDSIELILKGGKDYMGDTTVPISFKLYQLDERVINKNNAEDYNFYNNQQFKKSGRLVGSKTMLYRPGIDTALSIKLSDDFGRELYNMFKNNANEIQTDIAFYNYIKGFVLEADSTTSNSIANFSLSPDSALIKLHYRSNDLVHTNQTMAFTYNNNYQFNHIANNLSNTSFARYNNQYNVVVSTAESNDIVAVSGLYKMGTKISFPQIFNYLEINNYLKIVKAELIIKVSKDTYTTVDELPIGLRMYESNDQNETLSLSSSTSTTTESGNDLAYLQFDPLKSEKPTYTFDVTSYITYLMEQGKFTKSSLMITPLNGLSTISFNKAAFKHNQIDKDIQLKLYILSF